MNKKSVSTPIKSNRETEIRKQALVGEVKAVIRRPDLLDGIYAGV